MQADYWARFFEIVPIGLASGLLSGAFGVGGGIITVPVLKNVLGISAHLAVGNSLAVILPTAIIGTINYLKKGQLVLSMALSCGIPAVVGTIVASELSSRVQGQVLMLLLAALMMLVGLDFLTGLGGKLKASSESSDKAFELNKRNTIVCIILGIVTGLLSGLLGVGGGFIMVPCFCYFLMQPLKVAFGTSLVVIAMVALPGTIVHAMAGHVQMSIVAPMLAGSMPGAWLGSYIALRTRDKLLRMIFGVILVIMACMFAYRELTHLGGA